MMTTEWTAAGGRSDRRTHQQTKRSHHIYGIHRVRSNWAAVPFIFIPHCYSQPCDGEWPQLALECRADDASTTQSKALEIRKGRGDIQQHVILDIDWVISLKWYRDKRQDNAINWARSQQEYYVGLNGSDITRTTFSPLACSVQFILDIT